MNPHEQDADAFVHSAMAFGVCVILAVAIVAGGLGFLVGRAW